MIDPLAEVVMLLQPGARFSKLVLGASPWRISRSDAGQPLYCAILEGGCRIAIDGHEPIELLAGDFVLIPAAYGVSMSSLEPPPPGIETALPVALGNGEFRIGAADSPIDARMLAGHCSFGSPDAYLLVSLLPRFVHVRGEQRLATLVELVREESREQRPAREVVLSRLLEVLLIEALRSMAGTDASPGLVRGYPTAVSRSRSAECTNARRTRGRWLNSRRRPRFPARPFSNASAARWALRRWSTCSPGAWRWRRTCCAVTKAGSPRLRNASATAPPVPSALPSRGTSVVRPRSMRARSRRPRPGCLGRINERLRAARLPLCE